MKTLNILFVIFLTIFNSSFTSASGTENFLTLETQLTGHLPINLFPVINVVGELDIRRIENPSKLATNVYHCPLCQSFIKGEHDMNFHFFLCSKKQPNVTVLNVTRITLQFNKAGQCRCPHTGCPRLLKNEDVGTHINNCLMKVFNTKFAPFITFGTS